MIGYTFPSYVLYTTDYIWFILAGLHLSSLYNLLQLFLLAVFWVISANFFYSTCIGSYLHVVKIDKTRTFQSKETKQSLFLSFIAKQQQSYLATNEKYLSNYNNCWYHHQSMTTAFQTRNKPRRFETKFINGLIKNASKWHNIMLFVKGLMLNVTSTHRQEML